MKESPSLQINHDKITNLTSVSNLKQRWNRINPDFFEQLTKLNLHELGNLGHHENTGTAIDHIMRIWHKSIRRNPSYKLPTILIKLYISNNQTDVLHAFLKDNIPYNSYYNNRQISSSVRSLLYIYNTTKVTFPYSPTVDEIYDAHLQGITELNDFEKFLDEKNNLVRFKGNKVSFKETFYSNFKQIKEEYKECKTYADKIQDKQTQLKSIKEKIDNNQKSANGCDMFNAQEVQEELSHMLKLEVLAFQQKFLFEELTKLYKHFNSDIKQFVYDNFEKISTILTQKNNVGIKIYKLSKKVNKVNKKISSIQKEIEEQEKSINFKDVSNICINKVMVVKEKYHTLEKLNTFKEKLNNAIKEKETSMQYT